jgi:hypothetical protein
MSDTTPGGWPDAARPGVPLNPEVSAWHWLPRATCKPEPTEYRVLADGDGYWWWNGSFVPAERVGKHILRYLGPCHTPAEVAVMVKAQVEDALLHTLHPEFGSIYDADGEVTKAIEPLQAEIERLRAGLMRVLQYENKCDQTGKPCDVARGCPCACSLEAETWCGGGGT